MQTTQEPPCSKVHGIGGIGLSRFDTRDGPLADLLKLPVGKTAPAVVSVFKK